MIAVLVVWEKIMGHPNLGNLKAWEDSPPDSKMTREPKGPITLCVTCQVEVKKNEMPIFKEKQGQLLDSRTLQLDWHNSVDTNATADAVQRSSMPEQRDPQRNDPTWKRVFFEKEIPAGKYRKVQVLWLGEPGAIAGDVDID
jgi:hypothetical protein